jgi:hypothetical protein
MPEIINIVGLLVVVCIAWVVWTERKSKQALDKDALDQAWREVPDDHSMQSGVITKNASG